MALKNTLNLMFTDISLFNPTGEKRANIPCFCGALHLNQSRTVVSSWLFLQREGRYKHCLRIESFILMSSRYKCLQNVSYFQQLWPCVFFPSTHYSEGKCGFGIPIILFLEQGKQIDACVLSGSVIFSIHTQSVPLTI